jgi:hypothetical protein
VPGEDALAEPRREPLDLSLHDRRQIARRPGRHVAVRVAGVLARRRAARVEVALLHDEHERPVRVLAPPHGGLRVGDLIQRPAHVHGHRVVAPWIAPWDRPVQRPIDLERAGAVAEPAQPTHVSRRQRLSAHARELRGARVEEHDAGRREIGEGPHANARLDPPAEVAEERREGAADRPGAAGRHRPVLDVRGEREDHPDGRGERPVERQDRVRRAAGEDGPGPPVREPRPEGAGGRAQPRHAEAGEPQRMPRDAEWPEQVGEERVWRREKRGEETHVRGRVGPELGRRRLERAPEQHRGLVVERVRHGHRRADPAEPVALERQRPEERRENAHRVAPRADVVQEPGQRQLRAPGAATHLVSRLEHAHGGARPRQLDGGREPVRPGADHDRVVHALRPPRSPTAGARPTFRGPPSPRRAARAPRRRSASAATTREGAVPRRR